MALTLSRGRASVRAGRLVIARASGPHASALRLIIYKVSAIWLTERTTMDLTHGSTMVETIESFPLEFP